MSESSRDLIIAFLLSLLSFWILFHVSVSYRAQPGINTDYPALEVNLAVQEAEKAEPPAESRVAPLKETKPAPAPSLTKPFVEEARPEPAAEPLPRQTDTARREAGADISSRPSDLATAALPSGSPAEAPGLRILKAAPRYQLNPKPRYPFLALRRGLEGEVTLLVEVTAAGEVAGVTVKKSSGHKILDDAAVTTVSRKWRFFPARLGGESVPDVVEFSIDFKLSSPR
jgi:protein TonB